MRAALVDQETVRAIVEGYAAGLWKLVMPSGSARSMARFAPAFGFARTVSDERFPYTAEVVADFAGMPVNRVKYALGALEAIEAKKVRPEHFRGLSAERFFSRTDSSKRFA